MMFGRQLEGFVNQVREERGKKNVLFLCIGSDRSTGDSLGPLVGYKLERKGTGKLLGTLKKPVHAVNLEETVSRIGTEYQDSVVVAVDASIGRHEHVGYITVGLGALKPGLGVRKNLSAVGDIFITGIVGSGSSLDRCFAEYQTVRGKGDGGLHLRGNLRLLLIRRREQAGGRRLEEERNRAEG